GLGCDSSSVPCAGDSSGQHRAELGRSWHVTPQVLQGDRELSLAQVTQGGFPSQLRVLLELEGTQLVLELEQNWELVLGTGALLYYLPNGTQVTQEASEQEHCCYRGTVQGFPSSWARLCACTGFSGHIWLSETRSYELEPDASGPPGQHIAYRLRKVWLAPRACGQGPPDTPQAEETGPSWPQRGKRALAEQRFVELVMVVDHTAVSAGQVSQVQGLPHLPANPLDTSLCAPSPRSTVTYSAST
ncbi:ADA15 protein, partial [Semnornis frantzii]|nr:ADA15 protein [Semnornis frantzii]